MTYDDKSSKPKTSPGPKKARARTVAAKRDDDRVDSEDQPSVDAERPHATLAEPALTLPVSEPAPRRSIGLGLGAFAVVLLIGGSVALLLTREPSYPKIETVRSDVVSITDVPSAAPASAPMAAAPAAAEPPVSPPAAAAPAPIVPSAEAAPPRAPLPTAPPTVAQTRSANPKVSRRAAPQAELAEMCASLPPGGRARCIERPLDDADARLADAFDAAVDAGAPWPLLRRYRAAWDGLRSRAVDDPAGVASAYYAMAEELDDISRSRFGPR